MNRVFALSLFMSLGFAASAWPENPFAGTWKFEGSNITSPSDNEQPAQVAKATVIRKEKKGQLVG